MPHYLSLALPPPSDRSPYGNGDNGGLDDILVAGTTANTIGIAPRVLKGIAREYRSKCDEEMDRDIKRSKEAEIVAAVAVLKRPISDVVIAKLQRTTGLRLSHVRALVSRTRTKEVKEVNESDDDGAFEKLQAQLEALPMLANFNGVTLARVGKWGFPLFCTQGKSSAVCCSGGDQGGVALVGGARMLSKTEVAPPSEAVPLVVRGSAVLITPDDTLSIVTRTSGEFSGDGRMRMSGIEFKIVPKTNGCEFMIWAGQARSATTFRHRNFHIVMGTRVEFTVVDRGKEVQFDVTFTIPGKAEQVVISSERVAVDANIGLADGAHVVAVHNREKGYLTIIESAIVNPGEEDGAVNNGETLDARWKYANLGEQYAEWCMCGRCCAAAPSSPSEPVPDVGVVGGGVGGGGGGGGGETKGGGNGDGATPDPGTDSPTEAEMLELRQMLASGDITQEDVDDAAGGGDGNGGGESKGDDAAAPPAETKEEGIQTTASFWRLRLCRPVTAGTNKDSHHLHVRQIVVLDGDDMPIPLTFEDASPLVAAGPRGPALAIDGDFSGSTHNAYPHDNKEDHFMEFSFSAPLERIAKILVYNRVECAWRIYGSALSLRRGEEVMIHEIKKDGGGGNQVVEWVVRNAKHVEVEGGGNGNGEPGGADIVEQEAKAAADEQERVSRAVRAVGDDGENYLADLLNTAGIEFWTENEVRAAAQDYFDSLPPEASWEFEDGADGAEVGDGGGAGGGGGGGARRWSDEQTLRSELWSPADGDEGLKDLIPTLAGKQPIAVGIRGVRRDTSDAALKEIIDGATTVYTTDAPNGRGKVRVVRFYDRVKARAALELTQLPVGNKVTVEVCRTVAMAMTPDIIFKNPDGVKLRDWSTPIRFMEIKNRYVPT